MGVKWRKVEEICLILEKDVFYLSDIVAEPQKSCGTDFDSWQV